MGTGGRVQVEVLGPVRILEPGGRDLAPNGALQRRLSALLVLCRGRVVSVDSASDVLWPSKLPRDPVGTLHNHLSRLRHKLPAALIESVGDGFRIDPSTIDVGVDRLTTVLSRGVAADAAALAEIDTVLSVRRYLFDEGETGHKGAGHVR